MPIYKISEVVFAAIALHIFKEGSRNGFNNLRNERQFLSNYAKAFKMRLPHLDTVDIAMRNISNDVLEELKTHLVKCLITKKIFYKYRLLGKYLNISIDATGTKNISEANIENFPNAVFKIYNKGTENEKTVYFIYVLEAKLVCRNGFCISLGTEWIENLDKEFEKQDCELKAFYRLAETLKINYPRLPICIVGDGLYPNQKVFEICLLNNWEWIFTFKDGNLPSAWDQILQEQLMDNSNKNKLNNLEEIKKEDSHKAVVVSYHYHCYAWVNSIKYSSHEFNWANLIVHDDNGEIIHDFVFITSFKLSKDNIVEIIKNGRMRFKIENEGFNIQKNLGYSLKHKFSETSELAMKNYYTCLQIGHLINQLFELQVSIRDMVKGRRTICSIWKFVKSFFSLLEIKAKDLERYIQEKKQIKFE